MIMSVQNDCFDDLYECLSPPLLSSHATEHLGAQGLLFVQVVLVASAIQTHTHTQFFSMTNCYLQLELEKQSCFQNEKKSNQKQPNHGSAK